jgi:hypothetical protein
VEVQEQVGLLCSQLSRWPSLDGIIRGGGAGAELDELLATLRDTTAPDPERVSQWIDAIEDACARKGLAGITTRDHAYQPLPPGMSAAQPLQAWVCPLGCCDRVTMPEEAPQIPTCTIGGGIPMASFAVPS